MVKVCADGDRPDKSSQIGIPCLFTFSEAADAPSTCPEGGHVKRGWNHRGRGRRGFRSGPSTHPLLHVTEQVRNISSC